MTTSNRKQQKQSANKPRTGLGLLRFKADGSQVTIQHAGPTSTTDGGRNASRTTAVPTLRVDLKSSKVWVGTAAPLPTEGAGAATPTLGIAGMLRLERGSILVLISKAKRVCGLLDGPVYKVEDTSLVAHEAINGSKNDLGYASLLQEALNPKCFGAHLYFSHTANITASRQQQGDQDAPSVHPSAPPPDSDAGGGEGGSCLVAPLGAWWEAGSRSGQTGSDAASASASDLAASSIGQKGGAGKAGAAPPFGRGGTLWSRADPRFLWNRELMQPLIDAGGEAFALPLMAGYLGQATGATFRLRRPIPPAVSHGAAGTAAERGDGSSAEPAPADGDGSAAGSSAAAAAAAAAERRVPGDLTLITRLGVERPVAGGWRRGADRHGNTAGFAETELILTLWHEHGVSGQPQEQAPGTDRDSEPPAGEAGEEQQPQQQPQEQGGGGGEPEAASGLLRTRSRVAVASFVMARGSAPLYWAAPPDMTPRPAPLGPEDSATHRLPFAKHMAALHAAYGRTVLLLNLVHGGNQRRQQRMQDALQQQVDDAAACASTHAGPGPTPDASLVGVPLSRTQLRQLASCGPAAARLEGQCAEQLRAIRAFVSVDDMELTVRQEAPATGSGGGDGASASAANSGGGGGSKGAGATRSIACVGRRVHCRQQGVVRLSSASTASAGGCCEEVELAQHCLALPVLAELLTALGAMDDPADLATAHASVMQALAQLWSHMADVLTDQAHGTASVAGRLLRSAAAGLEGRGALGALTEAALRAPWRALSGAGDAVSRYYYSNFTDARRQDAMDLASGAFKMCSPPPPLPRRQPPSTTSLQLGILLVLAAIVQVVMCAYQRLTDPTQLLTRVAAPFALGGVLLGDVLRRGRGYVEQPLLLPGALYPWAD